MQSDSKTKIIQFKWNINEKIEQNMTVTLKNISILSNWAQFMNTVINIKIYKSNCQDPLLCRRYQTIKKIWEWKFCIKMPVNYAEKTMNVTVNDG